jgi:hypothetical protein
MKHYLVESYTIDCAKDAVKQVDLMESLNDKPLTVEVPVMRNGKQVLESKIVEVSSVYRVPISRPGKKNKNNRTYTLERTWAPALQKSLGEGSIGLLNHPKAGEAPDIKDAAVIWRNHKAEYDENNNPLIKADMYILKDPKGNGGLIESIINAGAKVDLSTRGYGEIDESGVVYNYEFKSTDIVYEGSYSVQVEQEQKLSGIPEVKESVLKINNSFTNNKMMVGDQPMNKAILSRLVNESMKKDNKFVAYTELSDLAESIKGQSEYADIMETIQKNISKIKPILEADYEGDSNDNGSADADNAGLDPEKKIKDTKEKTPEDVDSMDVEDINDTTDAERTGKLGIKAGSSEKGMNGEVNSGEVSHANQGVKTEGAIGRAINRASATYKDTFSPFSAHHQTRENVRAEAERHKEALAKGDKNKAEKHYARLDHMTFGNAKAVLQNYKKNRFESIDNELINKIFEDSDEQLPNDIDTTEIEKTADTTKRPAYTDMVAGGGGDVDKKQDVAGDEEIEKLEDINLESLSSLYLKLETYTLKAEQVVEMDKNFKEKAQGEVNEAVEYLKQLKLEHAELVEQVSKQQEYIEKLEDLIIDNEKACVEQTEVLPYVNEMLVVNPQLIPFAADIKKAKSVELAERFSAMKGKIRLDRVIPGTVVSESAEISESASYLKNRNWL